MSIINDEDEVTVYKKQPPCQYSIAELNERAQKAVNDYETGKRLIPHEQTRRKIYVSKFCSK